MTRLHPRATSLTIAAAVLGFALAACGDSADTTASGAADGSGAASPPTATVETLNGSEKVTPLGDVAVGQTATFTGSIFDGGKSYDAPLRVGVSAITKGSASDLAAFDLDAKAKRATPY